jgi:hypothetical protein
MDVLCLHCATWWDTEYVTHYAPKEFERKGCVITSCPGCPLRTEPIPPAVQRRLAILTEMAEPHGDDLEAFAADLYDFWYATRH